MQRSAAKQLIKSKKTQTLNVCNRETNSGTKTKGLNIHFSVYQLTLGGDCTSARVRPILDKRHSSQKSHDPLIVDSLQQDTTQFLWYMFSTHKLLRRTVADTLWKNFKIIITTLIYNLHFNKLVLLRVKNFSYMRFYLVNVSNQIVQPQYYLKLGQQ